MKKPDLQRLLAELDEAASDERRSVEFRQGVNHAHALVMQRWRDRREGGDWLDERQRRYPDRASVRRAVLGVLDHVRRVLHPAASDLAETGPKSRS